MVLRHSHSLLPETLPRKPLQPPRWHAVSLSSFLNICCLSQAAIYDNPRVVSYLQSRGKHGRATLLGAIARR